MLDIRFEIFPELTTERLVLRQMQEEYAPVMYQLRSDKEVMRYICKPLARSVEEMALLIKSINEAIKNNEAIWWAITLKESPKMIGKIGFHKINKEHHRAEIGYLLSPQYHKGGLMQEAMVAVLQYGFDTMHLHSVEANVDEANMASVKLLERNHFKREAHFKENYYFDGAFLDSVIYSLVNKENPSRRGG